MNIKFSVIQRFLFCMLLGFSLNTFAAEAIDAPLNERITKTLGNEQFVVRLIEVSDPKTHYLKLKKVAVYPQVKRSEMLKTFLEKPTGEPDLGQPLWTISPDRLPITMDDCVSAEIDECYGRYGCFKPCVMYGPELLGFDQKSGLIYISIASTDIGTSGGHYFTFVADTNKKRIKFIKVFYGPFVGHLSPSGKYLLLNGWSFITVYNTQTGEDYSIYKKNNYQAGKERYYSLGDIQWLSDTRFTYQEGEYHYKFQHGYDGVIKKEHDILAQRTLTETVIKPWKREDTR